MSGDQSGQVDHGSPFMRVFGADNAETLAARFYHEMCTIWSEKEVRSALKWAMTRTDGGRPARQRLEPFEKWTLGLYELWLKVPDRGSDDKLGFAKYMHEKFGGQSVEAIRKQLDRLIEFADKNP